MKNILSITIFALLFLGLGALALTAAPGDAGIVAGSAPQVPESVNSLAPDAALNWNEIAMPLDGTADIPDAQAIADQIAGTQILQRWDAAAQTFEFYVPDPVVPGGFGTNFATEVGGAYFVQVNNTAPAVFTVVGDVPPQTGNPGAVQFNLVGAPGAGNCKWNHISSTLDQSAITTAQELADSIGDVALLQHWNADDAIQTFEFYVPDPVVPGGFGTNFDVKIGYPYFVCMSANTAWPS